MAPGAAVRPLQGVTNACDEFAEASQSAAYRTGGHAQDVGSLLGVKPDADAQLKHFSVSVRQRRQQLVELFNQLVVERSLFGPTPKKNFAIKNLADTVIVSAAAVLVVDDVLDAPSPTPRCW